MKKCSNSSHIARVIGIGVWGFLFFSFCLFSFSSVISSLIERAEVLHCCSKKDPWQPRLQAKKLFFFFPNWIEICGIANSNLMASCPSLGLGEQREWLGLLFGTGHSRPWVWESWVSSPEWGWDYVWDTSNQWWAWSWDPRLPQWWRTPLLAILETSEARMR